MKFAPPKRPTLAALAPVALSLPIGLVTLVLLLNEAWGWDLGDALIPLRDAEAVSAIDEVKRLVAEDNLEAGIERLQRVHEAVWGRNLVFTEAEPETSGDFRVSRGATEVLIDLLKSLPLEGKTRYRAQFDLAAQALYTRALVERDVELLVRCYELYPITATGARAALAAGDLFLETGEVFRAERAWEAVDRDAAPEVWKARRTRGLLLGAHRGDRATYAKWRGQLDTPEVDGLPGPPSESPSPDPLADVPLLPFSEGEFHWETLPALKRAGLYPTDVHFSHEACVSDGWAAITSYTKIQRYDLSTGKLLGSVSLPRPAGDPDYEEHDASLRLRPVTDGRYLVSSYVAAANPREEFFGYDIKIPVPQRGLRGYSADRLQILWDTARKASSPRGDSDITKLSFNSTLLIDRDRLYALAWRQSGYVNAYLVCLDLATGRTIWQTILVGNQVELTMFGEIAVEPFLGDLLIEDGIVYASTNLGVIAAVNTRNGVIRWLTEYPNVDVRPTRRSQGRRRRTPTWDRNPLISFEDRLIVTPFDGEHAFVVSKGTGAVTQQVAHSSLGRFLVGLHGDHLVFCGNGRRLLLAAARDLEMTKSYQLKWTVRARPALVRDGIVYSAQQGGLYHRSFLEDSDRELCPPRSSPTRLRSFQDDVQDGVVTVLADRILVTNSYRVQGFRQKGLRKSSDAGGKKERR